MASNLVIPPKNASAAYPLEVDFSSQLDIENNEAVVAIETSAAVFSGVDANPEDILDGLPTLAQNTVTQNLTGGVAGVVYIVGFNASTNLDNHLIIYAHLAVLSDNPF